MPPTSSPCAGRWWRGSSRPSAPTPCCPPWAARRGSTVPSTWPARGCSKDTVSSSSAPAATPSTRRRTGSASARRCTRSACRRRARTWPTAWRRPSRSRPASASPPSSGRPSPSAAAVAASPTIGRSSSKSASGAWTSRPRTSCSSRSPSSAGKSSRWKWYATEGTTASSCAPSRIWTPWGYTRGIPLRWLRLRP